MASNMDEMKVSYSEYRNARSKFSNDILKHIPFLPDLFLYMQEDLSANKISPADERVADKACQMKILNIIGDSQSSDSGSESQDQALSPSNEDEAIEALRFFSCANRNDLSTPGNIPAFWSQMTVTQRETFDSILLSTMFSNRPNGFCHGGVETEYQEEFRRHPRGRPKGSKDSRPRKKRTDKKKGGTPGWAARRPPPGDDVHPPPWIAGSSLLWPDQVFVVAATTTTTATEMAGGCHHTA
eukprot:CAMPEP_0113666700 /NCGR_PEP_ID=MMETSP0038_2-20120614/3022_1 /TAXON_ID=2898 /ORGANISM="Cryptomonas paramecium" /LENGTH=240 /DNA_ID=CAMNT_0000582225 /DNA_START=56 /DNA_END=775 /DNA_ORIENTATION=+ /assembly_acc=CAM_ASM_000170